MFGFVAKLKNRVEHRLLRRAISRYIDHPIVTKAFMRRLQSRGAEIVMTFQDHTIRFIPGETVGRHLVRAGSFQRDIFDRALETAERTGRLCAEGNGEWQSMNARHWTR